MTPPIGPIDPADRAEPVPAEDEVLLPARDWDRLEHPSPPPPPVKAPPPASRKPKPQDLKISARQYIRARRQRWEQSAGFIAEMRNHHGADARKVRSDWDRLWDAFWARPVK